MGLHQAILNLPAPRTDCAALTPDLAFKLGHKEARHAGAELALAADAGLEALKALVESAERKESMVSTFLLIDAREALNRMEKALADAVRAPSSKSAPVADSDSPSVAQYFLIASKGEREREVTVREFCRAERAAGFRPKLPSTDPAYLTTPATSSFSNGSIEGRTAYAPQPVSRPRPSPSDAEMDLDADGVLQPRRTFKP